jgi:hypothetical protein
MDALKGMKMLLLSLITGVVLLSCTPFAQTGPPQSSPTPTPTASAETSAKASTPTPESSQAREDEQAVFEAEGRIRRPVTVPDDVLRILRQDERNQRRLEEGKTPADMPASWFVGSNIHLNDDHLPDLVVMAANPRLLGANIVPFWIFHNTPQGHQLGLHTMTLGLKVLKSKTNGYRDISTTEVAAGEIFDTVYTFNGTEYRMARRSKERIKE